jgi:hypothetical protein
MFLSPNHSALNLGASLACVAVMLVVFTFGMGGFLANWAGLITEDTNPNLYFFQLFAAGEPYMHTVTGMDEYDWLNR